MDSRNLTLELDRVKSKVFMGKNSAFLGSLLSSLEFMWDSSCQTAWTDGVRMGWNPDWFLSLPPETRQTVFIHELWHVARLHMIRIGSRDPLIWNYACDIRINNDLENDKFTFVGTSPWKDQNFGLMPEEDIYDILYANSVPPPNGGGAWSQGTGSDLKPLDKATQTTAINNVVQAIHQSKLAGQAGLIPGDITLTIDKFLAPKIHWERHLYQFFTDLLEDVYTWSRPNRRYTDMYLPSRMEEDGRLASINYYIDVSGSITDQQIVRANSEIKYLKETFKPKKLTVVQFDTRISDITIFEEDDPFEKIIIVGRGGTSLVCVREHMIETDPTAAIIFSDMYCAPMQPLPREIPTIWIVLDNATAEIPFGKKICIKD